MNLLEIPGKYSKECKKILENMYRYSYNYICAKENLSTAPLAYYHYDVGKKENHIYDPKKPNRNGKYIVLPVKRTVKYMKFSLALNLYTTDDNKDRKGNKLNLTVQSLAERSALNRTSLELYVDNLKVPDTQVFITVMNGTTDIYVPASYYEINGSFMDLIVRRYNKKEPYMNYVLTNYSEVSDRATISITGATLQNGNGNKNIIKLSELTCKFKEDDLRIYRNGRFMQPSYYKLKFLDENNFIFILENNESITITDVFEFHIEPHTTYVTHKMSLPESIIKFPNNILPGLPIAPGLCDMYIDGKRIFDRDIEVVSPRIFNIKNSIYQEDVRFSLLMNADLEKIDTFDYMEDTSRYYMTLGENYVEEIVLRNNYPDTGLEWLKKSTFPEQVEYNNAKHEIPKTSVDKYTEDTIKAYIDQNAHNIIPLVSEFSEDTIEENTFDQNYIRNYTRNNTNQELGNITYKDDIFISNNGNESGYSATFGTFKSKTFDEDMVVFRSHRYFDSLEEDILVFVNGIKLTKADITIISFRNNMWVYVPRRLLPKHESFRISLKHIPIYNKTEQVVLLELDELSVYNNVYYFEESQFGNIQDVNDIYVYKILNTGCMLLQHNTDYTLVYNKEAGVNGSVELRFNDSYNKSISDRYYLTNISYYQYKRIDVNNENIISMVLDEYDKNYKCYKPKATHYNIMLFRNGIMLLENIDFYITSQLTNNRLYQSQVVFRNRGEIGDSIELYIVEEPKLKFGTCKVLNLPYNVIYLKNSILGFHNSYSDLVINGQVVPKENIKVIALNLLLVKDVDFIQRPFISVYTRSTLARPIVSVMEYITYYNDHQSDWKLYLDRLYREGRLDEILQIVEKFVTDEEKHPLEENYGDEVFTEPLLDKIARDLRDGNISRYINCNKPLTFLDNMEYIQIMSEEDNDLNAISLNCNLFNVISILLSINPQTHLRSVEDITEIVSDAIKSRQFPFLKQGILDANIEITDEEYYDVTKYPISNKLYLEELHLAEPDYDSFITDNRPINANTSDWIIDARAGEDYDYELEEKSISIPFTKFKRSLKRNYNELTGKWEASPKMEFVYTIDLSSYNIEGKIKQFKVNSLIRKPTISVTDGKPDGDYRYYMNQELLEVSINLYTTDKIEIVYETRKYITN